MSRPSSGADLKLLAAGRKLAQEGGLSSLSVRQVCRAAGVNPGMFHYHFQTKEKFEQALLKGIYADFMALLRVEIEAGGDPRERMKKALCALGRMVRDNRALIAVLIKDVVGGNRRIISFIMDNCTEHVKVFTGLIGECRKAGLMGDMPLPNALLTLVLPVVVPCGGVGIMEKNKVQDLFPVPFFMLRRALLSDAAIEARVEAVLDGVLRRRGL